MKKYGLFGLILAAVIFQACTSPQQRRQDYVDEHPGLPAEISISILKGQIAEGMNREEVRAAWGDPERETLTMTETGNQEIWSYYTPVGRFTEGTVILTFIDGKLVKLVN